MELTQTRLGDRLIAINELQCTVLEVKVIEGLGTTMDVVLINGVLREGDTVVVCGLSGPVVTPIRSLLTPHPMKVGACGCTSCHTADCSPVLLCQHYVLAASCPCQTCPNPAGAVMAGIRVCLTCLNSDV